MIYRLLLWKRYFEIGGNVTGYLKFLIALFGLSSQDVRSTMLMGAAYALLTLIVGRYWHAWGLMKMEWKIGNDYNDLAHDVRKLVADKELAGK